MRICLMKHGWQWKQWNIGKGPKIIGEEHTTTIRQGHTQILICLVSLKHRYVIWWQSSHTETWSRCFFFNPPIYDNILPMLSPATCVRLARACVAAFNAVNNINKCAYNINRHLSHFFDDPLGFWSLQARTGTIISGSNALQFLDRTFYLTSDLDIYVNPGHTKEVRLRLIQQGGYSLSIMAKDHPDLPFKELIVVDPIPAIDDPLGILETYGTPTIKNLFTFTKMTATGETWKVELIGTCVSVFHAIMDFHSSKPNILSAI